MRQPRQRGPAGTRRSRLARSPASTGRAPGHASLGLPSEVRVTAKED
jgi:hypothetical protein